MSRNVIEISNLSKQYRLGQVGTTTMADDLKRWWYSVRGKDNPFLMIGEENDRSKKGNSQYVWALKDIDFSVKQGEVLGIIGKNGAGKSTLLKILSRTTSPSTGKYKIKGRVASLLEVGTGFHPDLTGRENVFLNGAILGMTKAEIRRQFDEIVDFSGVERYIDTPVKRYSSGMYVRLAFAVAAHLESEILIIDEVLAVGDQEFQDKCLGKMKDVSGAGRTVLFVSHNMASMKGLCSRGVLLERGTKIFEGNMSETVQKYLVGGRADGNLDYNLDNFRTVKSKALEISKIKLCNINAGTKSIYLNEPISIQIDIESKEIVPNVLMDCKIVSIEGIEIVHAMNTYQNAAQTIQIGLNSLEFKIENDLQPGNYYLTLGIHRPDGTTLEYLENCLSIEVLNVTSDNSKGHIYDYKLAYIRAKSEWKLK